jgi:hypothetical protein
LRPFLGARNLKSVKLANYQDLKIKKDEISTVLNFLNVQQNLKKLRLFDKDLSEALVKKEFADAFGPQLQKLAVDSVSSGDLLYFLRGLKSLKSLHISRSDYDVIDSLWTLEKNLMIEKISFGYKSYQEEDDDSSAPTIATLFSLNLLPNLKTISFLGFPKALLTDIMLEIQSTCELLEEMRFQECEVPSLEIKQISRVKIGDWDERCIKKFLNINSHVICSSW